MATLRFPELLAISALGCFACNAVTTPVPPARSDGGSAPVDASGVPPGDASATPVDAGAPLDFAMTAPRDASAAVHDLAMTAPHDLAMSAPHDLAMTAPHDFATTAPPDLSMLTPRDMTVAVAPHDMTVAATHDMASGTFETFVFYGASDGISEPILDASPDETGNIWAVSSAALYIRRPQDGFFRRYTNADGLHIYTVVTSVAGGASNEGWVGLEGYDSDTPLTDPLYLEEKGKAEHVHLMSDGSITSLQYADLHNDNSANYWETRSARRLLYAHRGLNTGHMFMGGNHGITNILNDGWGDHVHVEVTTPDTSQLMGEWYGLALDPSTQGLWTCGRYGCGLQRYYADPKVWVMGSYQYAFTVFTSDHGLVVQPGYEEDFVATAVDTAGVAYFLSRTKGLASWDPASQSYSAIRTRSVSGLGTPVDIVADPDGTMWVADTSHVIRWNPSTGATSTLSIPSSDVRRLYMDTLVSPRALYIATGNGVGIYRGK